MDRADLVEVGAAPERAPRSVASPPALADGPTGLLALQRAIGNRATGRYLSRQAAAEKELDKRWQVTLGNIPDEQADKLVTAGPHAVVFWVNYDLKNKNNAEFENAATDFAKTYKTLGMSGNDTSGATLKSGIPIEVKSRDDVVQAITGIHQTLHQLWWRRYQDSDEKPDEPKIGTVAIFCHGERDGLGIDHANASYTKEKHLPAFLGAIKPALTDDVKFLLYACSSGGGPDEKVDQTKMDTGLGGKGSFAEKLAAALGGGAEVYAHEVAGNVASNVYARRFKAGEDQGTSMFDALYGDSFVASEAARLRKDKTDLVGKYSDDELKATLKAAMWRHYMNAVSTDFVKLLTHNRHYSVGGYTGVGGAMFMDEAGTRDLLRADFQTYWLDDATIKNDFKRPESAKPKK